MPVEKPKIKAGAGIELGERLGKGAEKDIYSLPGKPDQVLGIYKEVYGKENPETMKARFYLMNILHSLYPDIFRKITTAAKGSGENRSYVVIERIDPSEDHKRAGELRMKFSDTAIQEKKTLLKKLHTDPKYHEFLKILQEIGMEPDPTYGVDVALLNFTKKPTGELQYIDTMDPWFNFGDTEHPEYELSFVPSKVRIHIQKHLKGEKQNQALRYLDRIIELRNELQARKTKKQT